MILYILNQITSFTAFILFQRPRNIPSPSNNEPLVLNTTFDYILVIGMPVLIAIGYYFWRKKKKEEAIDQ